MKLKLLSLAVITAALPLSNAMAQAPKVYGQVDVGLSRTDVGSADQFDVQNNESRIGFKGEEDLGGITGIYQAEFGFDVTGEDGGIFKSRNTFVGLKGDFGTVLAGIHDTPFKQAQGKIDLFSDQYDIKNYVGGEQRETSVIAYMTPDMNGLSATIMLQPGEGSDDNEAETQDGIADAVSLGLTYETDMIYAGLAYDMNVSWGYWGSESFGPTRTITADDPATLANEEVTTSNSLTDAIRLVGLLKFDSFGFGALFQTAEQADGPSASAEQDAVVLSAYAQVDQTKFEAMLGKTDNEVGASEFTEDFIGVGVEQQLSERTNVYAILARETEDRGTEIDTDFFMVGAKHKF